MRRLDCNKITMAFLLAALTGCAAQQIDLQQPSQPMLTAVDDATSQERIAPPGAAPGTGIGVGIGIGNGSIGYFSGTADTGPCTSQTASVLQTLAFDPDEVRSVRYDRRMTTSFIGGFERLQGYNAWVNFKDQDGYLVIVYNVNCQYQSYYTRYGLELPAKT